MNKFFTFEEVKEIASRPENLDNELLQISLKYNTTKLYSPGAIHYFEHYWSYFKDLKYKKLNILEIGVKDGQSLLIWKDFFVNSKIYGIEINKDPLKNFNHDEIEIFFGNQKDINFLKKITNKIKFDVILDDGGHTMDQQKESFKFLFPNGLKNSGLYIIEDLGTSYWSDWGGELLKKTTTIEYLKELIDGLNYRSYKGGRKTFLGIPDYKNTKATYFDENIKFINFYRNICFIKKGDNRS